MCVDEVISIIDKIGVVKVCLLVIGKTDAEFVRAGIAEYEKRLKYYIPYEMKVIPDVRNTKNMSEVQQKEREGELLLGQLEAADYVVLLDERGNEYTSKAFADFLAQKMLTSIKRLVFIIGGPYGFSEDIIIQDDFFSPDGEDDLHGAIIQGNDYTERRTLSS